MSEKSILKLHHVSLIVDDIDVALTFYQEVLGLELDTRRPDLGYPGAWLILPGQQQIHLMQLDDPNKNSESPKHGGRDYHVAFSVNSLDKLIASLEKLNVSFTKSCSGREALFCRDLDGNALEFIEIG